MERKISEWLLSGSIGGVGRHRAFYLFIKCLNQNIVLNRIQNIYDIFLFCLNEQQRKKSAVLSEVIKIKFFFLSLLCNFIFHHLCHSISTIYLVSFTCFALVYLLCVQKLKENFFNTFIMCFVVFLCKIPYSTPL